MSLWDTDVGQIKVFIEELNKAEVVIQFTDEIGNYEVNYFDLNIGLAGYSLLSRDNNFMSNQGRESPPLFNNRIFC